MADKLAAQVDLDKLRLNDFLNMADVASEARKIDEAVDRELNLDEKKAEIRKKLLDSAAARGENLTPAQADIAVENFFSGLYSFREPKRNFETTLAELYSDRARIGKHYGIPALAATFLAGVIWVGSSIASAVHTSYLEGKVESAVTQKYNDRQRVSMDLDEITASPLISQLPKTEEELVRKDVELSRRDLKEADKFFLEFCPNGDSKNAVTSENYSAVEAKIEPINALLNDAQSQTSQAREILRTQERLGYTKKSLDSIMTEIKNARPRDVFLQRAETSYNSGLSAIERRQIGEAESSSQQLMQIRTDINEFSGITSRVQRTYADIKSIAKENVAISQGEELYREATELIRTANVQRLSETAGKLEALDETLNQEYRILIVDRPGWKTGDDRYYNNDRGKPSYYILVEAIGPNGSPLPRNIRNCENGQTQRVTMWGEGVSTDTWERVKADKMDNHHVDNNKVGYKQRGYLNEVKTFYGLNGKQITSGDWRK